MLIGVISDTHDRYHTVDTSLSLFSRLGVNLVVHCGDWKSLETAGYFARQAASYGLSVRGVLGNNDLNVAGFLSLALSAPGDFQLQSGVLDLSDGRHRIAAYHGHHTPTRRQLLERDSHHIILLGHTHKPLITQSGGKLIVNPGSTAFSIPRSKDWRPSVAIVDTGNMTATINYLPK